jgi:hypothetical protein
MFNLKSEMKLPPCLIHRQFHFLEEGDVTRIFFDVAQQRIAFHPSQSTIALLVCSFEPLKGFICLATISVNFSDLKSQFTLILLDDLR